MDNKRSFYSDRFGRVNVENTDDGKPVLASREYIQALSYILGWIATSEAWTPILADVDGRLLVSTSPTKSNESISSFAEPSTTSIQIIAENDERKAIIIQNDSVVDCYLEFSGNDATSDIFKLEAGAIYSDDFYYGEINAITASGTATLKIVEFI